jgi:hypothetical protein
MLWFECIFNCGGDGFTIVWVYCYFLKSYCGPWSEWVNEIRRFQMCFNPWKPKLVWIILKNLLRCLKITQYICITKVNWLILFNGIIAVYSGNHTKFVNTLWARRRDADYESRWYTMCIYLWSSLRSWITLHVQSIVHLPHHFPLCSLIATRLWRIQPLSTTEELHRGRNSLQY